MSAVSDLGVRIRAYLEAMPPAISGSDGHGAAFNAAKAVILGFGLSIDQARPYLQEFNQRCEPPWSDDELEHKLASADANKKGLVRGYLLDGAVPEPSATPSTRPAPRKELTEEEKIQSWTNAVTTKLDGWRADPVDVWEASPIRLMEDFRGDALLAIYWLASDDPDDLINVNFDFRVQPDGKIAIVGPGITLSVAEWTEYLSEYPMPYREAGCWWRANPVRSRQGSGRDGSFTDADIAKFRFHLFEIDKLPMELQLSFFCRMRVLVAMISDSGGKSYHALVKSLATSLAEFEAEARYFLDEVFARYGVDPKNKNPSRYSRLPGVPRSIGARKIVTSVQPNREENAVQKILYLNPQAAKGPIL